MSKRTQKPRQRRAHEKVAKLPRKCGKHAYKRRKLALTAKAQSEKKSGTPLIVYKCEFCGYFHMARERGHRSAPPKTQLSIFTSLVRNAVRVAEEGRK